MRLPVLRVIVVFITLLLSHATVSAGTQSVGSQELELLTRRIPSSGVLIIKYEYSASLRPGVDMGGLAPQEKSTTAAFDFGSRSWIIVRVDSISVVEGYSAENRLFGYLGNGEYERSPDRRYGMAHRQHYLRGLRSLTTMMPQLYGLLIAEHPAIVVSADWDQDGGLVVRCSLDRLTKRWGETSESELEGDPSLIVLSYNRDGFLTEYLRPLDGYALSFTDGGGRPEDLPVEEYGEQGFARLVGVSYLPGDRVGYSSDRWIDDFISERDLTVAEYRLNIDSDVGPDSAAAGAGDVERPDIHESLFDRGRRAAGPRWSLVIGGLVLIGGALFFVIRARRA